MDIALYARSRHAAFAPALAPLMIIETKRRELDPVDTPSHEAQLANYLHLHQCRVGVLTNCRTLWGYQREGVRVQKTALHDFAELEDWIKREHAQAQHTLDQHMHWFQQAQLGSFETFRHLLDCYGKGTDVTITFDMQRNGVPMRVHGAAFRVTDETVSFRVLRGGVLREREECRAAMFRALVQIGPRDYQSHAVVLPLERPEETF